MWCSGGKALQILANILHDDARKVYELDAAN